MIKSFYKKREPQKIFFVKDFKTRSYAYGKSVHDLFLDWRKHHLMRWNNSKVNFLLCEDGDIGGNSAKVDVVGEVRVTEPKNQRIIKKTAGMLTPLVFEGMILSVNRDGEMLINDKVCDIFLGTELKAWGVSDIWINNLPSYTLFVVGKNKDGQSGLYGYAFDNNNRPTNEIKVSVPVKTTLSRKSKLFCFGRHVFLIHEAQLQYYYYNIEKGRLEEVAIGEDEKNEGKECCKGVVGTVVCDSNGYVHWQAGNRVYSFKIGYPSAVNCINLGDTMEISGVQCFKDMLFVYRKNKISNEYSCVKYVEAQNGSLAGQVFNVGAKYNLFYADKSGVLFYLKIARASRRGTVAKHNMSEESVISQVDLAGAEEVFCINGNIYLDCNYLAN